MARHLQTAALLLATLRFAAYGDLPVTGRLTADDGVTVLTGRYRLEASLATNVTSGAALSQAAVDVTTDADGYYAATLPLSPAAAFDRAETVWLRLRFFTPEGAKAAELPLQRIGYVPYSLHADRADRLRTGEASSASLAVAAASVGELVVTNRLEGSGGLIVTGSVETVGAKSVVRIDRLAIGAVGSSLLEAGGWTVRACASEASSALSATAEADGVFELELSSTGIVSVSLTRTAAEGKSETLVADEAVESGERARNWKLPVRTGDVVTASVVCGEGVTALLRGRTVGFGRLK